jgi:hypothetical protein
MENLHGRSLKWLRRIEVDEGVIYDNGGDWAAGCRTLQEAYELGFKALMAPREGA